MVTHLLFLVGLEALARDGHELHLTTSVFTTSVFTTSVLTTSVFTTSVFTTSVFTTHLLFLVGLEALARDGHELQLALAHSAF